MEAFARSAFFDLATTPAILEQNDALRPLSASVLGFGAGGFSLDPVARLYLARPLAVRPAPLLTGSFSPRPTDRETPFLAMLCAVVVVNVAGGVASNSTYNCWVSGHAAGTCDIVLRNISGGSLSEAVVLNFAIIHCT